MNATDRKLRRLEQIARLRRAQRDAPGQRDIASVRAELEAELGETVSQRLAARFLGVSHAALQRWIERGDLPLIYSRQGHLEVPVPVLLDLRESMDRERSCGGRRRHHLEPVLLEGRRRAERITAADLGLGDESENGHSRADRRALAYHRVVARRLDRAMLAEALHRTWKWRDEGKLDPRYADEWERILGLPLPEVRRALSSDDARGRELRQNSPFAGMLTEPERQRILELVR